MVDINLTILVITLNVTGLIDQLKHRVVFSFAFSSNIIN